MKKSKTITILIILIILIVLAVVFIILKSTSNNQTNSLEDNTYIGREEIESQNNNNTNLNDDEGTDEENSQTNTTEDLEDSNATTTNLTGKEKAIDIVTKEYATDGQTVTFDHMESGNYVIKVNEGTAITWYLVDGTTWTAEEY